MQNSFYILLLSTLLVACAGGSSSPQVSSENKDNANSDKQPALIDIATYNIEWLGNPESAKFDGSAEQQNEAAAEDILKGAGEIYALQEIGGQTALTQLINQLNILDGVNNWNGGISEANNQQSLAFIYKTNIIANVNFETLLTNQSSQSFSGRYPYMMTADVVINNVSHTLRLVNLHLKCCTGISNTNKRSTAMNILVPYLHEQYSSDNVIVLGDFNIADSGGSEGEIQNWGIYNDLDNDQQPDYSHAAGSVEDKDYNPSITDSDIDHILISNELKGAWLAVPGQQRNRYLLTTVSDHSPVATTLDLSLIKE
jgi:endonuclease/exonuclease/phosphatase family metal-dependent hydrolase